MKSELVLALPSLPMAFPRMLALTMALSMAFFAPMPTVAAAEDELPSGKEILERSIKVSGGREAFEKIDNRVIKATIEVKPTGIKMTMTAKQARPDKTLQHVEIQGLGTMIQGSNGEEFWEMNSMTGPRLLEGEEKATMQFLANFDVTVNEDQYEKIECVGVEDVEGETCYRVILTPKGLRPITAFYSKESGLEVKNIITLQTQMGEVTTENFLKDYKEVDGILMPHHIIQKLVGMETDTRFTSVEHNMDLPDDTFDLPEEVQKLVEQRHAQEAQASEKEE